jgi:hypothetical protein
MFFFDKIYKDLKKKTTTNEKFQYHNSGLCY